MVTNIQSRDIAETLSQRDSGTLEDEIFESMAKVQALCRVQSQLEDGDVTSRMRNHYAMVLEDQVNHLGALLDRHFG